MWVQGSPAFSNYGYKSNEELILGYGFMLRDNPADFFHVSLGLHAQTEDGIAPPTVQAPMHCCPEASILAVVLELAA